VFPLIALVTMLLLDFTPFLAAFWGIVLTCSSARTSRRSHAKARRRGELQGQTLTWKPLIEGSRGAPSTRSRSARPARASGSSWAR
jgi:TRAP-type uncharacterized transport system fused permease subunit